MSEPSGPAEDLLLLRGTVDRLRSEIEGLRLAMRSRAVIEQAKGVLTERLSCTPDEAFGHLVRLSQEHNRKVSEIAAALLGTVTPAGPAELPPLAVPPPPPVPAPGPLPAPVPVPLVTEHAAEYHLTAAALASATTPAELAARLMRTALAPLGVGAVALALLEPDGALRLAATHGVPAQVASQWQRIPPHHALPMTEAVRTGAPVWVYGRADFASRYPEATGPDLVPGETVCALPLRAGERVVGAMKLGWPGSLHPAPETERHLSALARLCAAQLLRVEAGGSRRSGSAPPGAEPWFHAVLEAMIDPVVILHAVRDAGGKVTDLRVAHANTATVDLAGRTGESITGRLFSELYPGMVSSGTFRHLLRAASQGVPYRGEAEQYVELVSGQVHSSTMTLNATPFLDGLLVSWRTHDEQERRERQLAQAQRLVGLGTWQWERPRGRIDCSPEVFQLLGLAPPAGPPRLDPATAEAAVDPADLPAVRLLVEQLLAGEPSAAIEFRVLRPDGRSRTVRVMAEALPGLPEDGVLALRGVVQDVTVWRHAETALADTRGRLADQVRQTAVEHRAVRALQHALMDVPSGPVVPGLEVTARYLPAESEGLVGGDWYDALALPDGTVLTVVGDVSGHGLRAAAGMAQLRDALRGMAFTGATPDQLLARLNDLLCHLGSDFIATAVCGLLDPAARTLTWARAGHLPPLLVRDGTARHLPPPSGPVLGALPGVAYDRARLQLSPDDLVLLYTDGLVERRGEDLDEGLHRLARVVEEYRVPDDLPGCLDHVLRRLRAPNPRDDTCLLGLRLR